MDLLLQLFTAGKWCVGKRGNGGLLPFLVLPVSFTLFVPFLFLSLSLSHRYFRNEYLLYSYCVYDRFVVANFVFRFVRQIVDIVGVLENLYKLTRSTWNMTGV